MKAASLIPLLGLMTALTLPAIAAEESPLKDKKEKVSYAIGVDIGRTLKSQGIEVDAAILGGAIADALADAKLKLTDEQMKATMMEFQKEMKGKAAAAAKEEGEKNAKAGAEYLANKEKEEGVKKTESGLLYKVVTQGKGEKPTKSDTVEVNYRGSLIDGTEFDSSYKRGNPASFPVGQVIPGWSEALQLMPVGSKWQLFIPSDLAYGKAGAGGTIGPNQTLVFDVELLEIKKDDAK